MLRSVLIVAAVLALAVPAEASPPRAPSAVALGFDGPESAVWDAQTNAWYVSNFGTAFGAGGSEGFIAKLPAGSLQPEVFATGLDAPQGVVIEDRIMYVADGDLVRRIDMENPDVRDAIEVPGASLNDLDVDPATGDIYVGELGAGRVWRIRDGVPEEWAEINAPDGLYLWDGGLYIGNFPFGGDSGVFRIDLATKGVTPVAVIPGATIDGLERDGDGWLITDVFRGQLLRVDADGAVSLLAQVLPTAADIGFDPVTRTVAIPEIAANAVVFVTV